MTLALALPLAFASQLQSWVMPHFGASLTDDSRVIIYERNMSIIEATACLCRVSLIIKIEVYGIWFKGSLKASVFVIVKHIRFLNKSTLGLLH